MGPLKNKTVRELYALFCILVDIPESDLACSTRNPKSCLECPVPGRFALDTFVYPPNYSSAGHVVTVIFCFATLIAGLIATLGNLLTIVVLLRHKKSTEFNTLLMGLASFDLVASVFSILHGFSFTTYLRKMSYLL